MCPKVSLAGSVLVILRRSPRGRGTQRFEAKNDWTRTRIAQPKTYARGAVELRGGRGADVFDVRAG